MILKIAFIYQLSFNALHFILIMPFIIEQDFLKVGLLYLAAAFPSFLFTVPVNKYFENTSIKMTLLGSAFFSFLIIFLLVYDFSYIGILIVLGCRSLVGSVFVPKLAQYVGFQKKGQRDVDVFVLQLILFLPGLLGYVIALALNQFNIVFYMVAFEFFLIVMLAFFLKSEQPTQFKRLKKVKSFFIFDNFIFFEMILITFLTYISLFYLVPLIAVFKNTSIFFVFVSFLIQLILVALLQKRIVNLSLTWLFGLSFCFLIGSFFLPQSVVYSSIIFGFVLVNFFIQAQHYWHNRVPIQTQSYFFSQRLVVTNCPKFIMCVIPTLTYFF